MTLRNAFEDLATEATLAALEAKAPALQAGGVPVTDNGGSLTIDAASLPLPAGAATSAKQDTLIAAVDGVEGVLGTIDADTSALAGTVAGGAVTVADGGGSITVDGPLTDAQLRAAAVPVSAAALPLPSGAATAAAQSTGNASLSSIDGKLPALATGRVPVDGSGVTQPVSAASLPLPTGAATAANQATLIGHVDGIEGLLTTIDADTGSIDGKLPALAAGRVPVDGSGVTQPISAVALPLPSGAATAAKQPAIGTAGTPSADVMTVQGAAGGTPIPASLASLPLPSGAATESTLSALNAKIPASPAQEGGNLATILGRLPTGLTVASTRLLVDGSGVTQPISAASLPLPSGAATAANQATIIGHVDGLEGGLGAAADAAASSDTGTFSLIALVKRGLQNWTTLLSRVPSLTVSATRLLVDGSGVTQPVSAASLPLPSGAATAANQSTANSSLSSIDGKTPALTGGRVPVDGSGVTQPVSGTVATTVAVRTPTTTSVSGSASSVTILASNASRRGVSIANDSTATLRLSFSTPATSANAFIVMPPGSFLLLDQQLIVTNALYGIWSAANGTAQVTEYA